MFGDSCYVPVPDDREGVIYEEQRAPLSRLLTDNCINRCPMKQGRILTKYYTYIDFVIYFDKNI